MKKGFTLIELLSVIIILAVIAVIAIPIVLGVVETTKKAALKESANALIEEAGYYYMQYGVADNVRFDIEESKINNINGNTLLLKGYIEDATVLINTKGEVAVCINDGEYSVYKNYRDNKLIEIDNKNCNIPTGQAVVFLDNESTIREYTNEELTTLVTSLQEQIQVSATAIAGLQQEIQLNESTITNLQQQIQVSATAITGLQQEIQLNESTITNLQQEITVLKNKPGDTPAGTVISYIAGSTAPTGYLPCDGTVYNISDYPNLANAIKAGFGSYNYYGGDGTTTFAVPDLRGEFLRGTGTATRNTGSGANIGVHQDGSDIPISFLYSSNNFMNVLHDAGRAGANGSYTIKNFDKLVPAGGVISAIKFTGTSTATSMSGASYSVRPTNTSVLYCIKY